VNDDVVIRGVVIRSLANSARHVLRASPERRVADAADGGDGEERRRAARRRRRRREKKKRNASVDELIYSYTM
jgi:hypothetical protein